MSTAPVTNEPYSGPAFDAHDKQYLVVALGLAALTAIEVVLSYTSLEKAALALPLLALAAIKFFVVAGYFMHLKNDSPVFRRLFIMGAVLAGFCYTAVLYAFDQFQGPGYWLIFIVGAVVVVVVWALSGMRNVGADNDDHAGHDHADHDHAGHADHDHAAAH